jgi:hypothetical protein
MSDKIFHLTSAHEATLIALARFHYLTATQLTRLLRPGLQDKDRWSQRKFKDLETAGYVLRLRALPPKDGGGRDCHVFTLAERGRRHMKTLGVPVEKYFRPSEETKAAVNTQFMPHTLAAIDVLISATCLERDHAIVSPRVLTERALKHRACRVEVPAGSKAYGEPTRTVAVIPDGWFELQEPGGPVISIALELDRGTEVQRVWRQKAAALALWAIGPYREAFQATNITIIVVCPDNNKRRDDLASWTLLELQERSLENVADIFLFTSTNPAVVTPAAFFYGRCLRSATSSELLSVLDPPAESEVVPLRA